MITNALVQARQLYEDTDGVLVCDKYGYVEYLKWFHEGFLSDEAIGMHVTEVYPELDNQTSSIMRVIESGVPRFDERQVIHNCKGELLDIVSSTIPLLAGSEVVGAMTSTIFYDKYKAGKGLPKRRQGELYTLDDIISQAPIMIALKERCALIANNDSPVLLYGETGTGKELFAQSLHTCSHRAKKPFISQNCAAIPESLLEGIFFGVEKGSFTGAENRKGLFELADGGTLFLDEINSMDISMQAKLLKAIEEQQVRRIGSAKSTHFHTRIICAMNKSPAEVLRAGLMRTDLFYRICVVRIDIPPLRDRKPDVMILTDYFINHFNRTMGKSIRGVSALVKMTFQNYNWKGNVRELKNTLEYAFNLCQGNIINMGDLPDILQEDLEPQIFPQENSGCFPGPSLPAAPAPDGRFKKAENSIEGVSTGEENAGCLAARTKKLSKNRQERAGERESLSGYFYDEHLSLTENTAIYEKEAIRRALERTDSITEAARLLRISRQTLSYKIEKYRLN